MSSIAKPAIKPTWNPFSINQWVAWLAATFVAAISMTSFVYMTFQTKESAQELKESGNKNLDQLEKRLDRIENKVDQILEWKKR